MGRDALLVQGVEMLPVDEPAVQVRRWAVVVAGERAHHLL